MFHKKGGIPIDKLLKIALVLAVVVIVILFLFKFNFMKLLNNLIPGFESEVEKVESDVKVEFGNLEPKSSFEFGGGRTSGEGAERPIDYNQYERFNQKIPEPINYVSDYAEVISESKESRLNNLLSSLEKDTSVEFAIVSVSSMRKGYKEVALAIFNKWGIGQKDKNNGILVIFSLEDNVVRMQIGEGHITGVLNDGRVGNLLDEYIVGNLNEQRIENALLDLVDQTSKIIRREYFKE